MQCAVSFNSLAAPICPDSPHPLDSNDSGNTVEILHLLEGGNPTCRDWTIVEPLQCIALKKTSWGESKEYCCWQCEITAKRGMCVFVFVFVYFYLRTLNVVYLLHTVKCCDQWGLQLRAECQSAFSTRRSKRVKEISFMTVSSTILRILRTKISRCVPSMNTMFIKCQYIQQGKASRSKHIVSSKKIL